MIVVEEQLDFYKLCSISISYLSSYFYQPSAGSQNAVIYFTKDMGRFLYISDSTQF